MSDHELNELDRFTRRLESWATAAERESRVSVNDDHRQRLIELATNARATVKGCRANVRQGRPDTALWHARQAAGALRWSLLSTVTPAVSVE